MLIRLTPQAPHPTVLFTIAFNNLPETLPSPLSWANQLNCLAADELDVPTSHHCLDKAACIPSLLESITFDLITMTASCSFVDGVTAEWPLFDHGCLKALHGVVNDVSMSALEAERERFREKEEEQQRLLDLMTPPPSPLKPKGHKKQRSLLMTMIASLVPLGRQSLAPTLPTSAPPSPPPSPRPTASSFASFPPPSLGPDARTLRRRARSTLVDTFRRYILPELTRHFPRAGYYAWIVQSTLRRATMRANVLIEKSGGHIPDLGRPRRGDWIEFGQDPFLDTTTACTPSSLYDDDDDDTDTDGSSVHTPSSSHFNTMTSAYTSQFASSQPSTPYNRPPSSHSLPMYTPRPTLSPQEVEEYHILSNLIARLQHLFIAVQSQNTHIENDNAHHEAMLEIRSRRRAWLNRNLVGSARCSSRTIGLSMPFRSSPLAQSSWTCEEYDLVMTPVNLDAFMEDRILEPDYESRLSEGVSRLRLSDGPKLFPVLEESEGDFEDEQAFVSREFGMEFGVDLEAQRSPQIGESGDMEVGSEGLQVEFDTPHIRPRLRTSSMMAHRRRFDDLPTSNEVPSSPSSSCSSLLSTPPPSSPTLLSSPPMQLDSSSLLCQPLKRTSSVEMTDSTMATDLERSQIYSDMDVDMGVYEFGNMKHPQDQEFTLGMDLPLRIPIPVRGRKQQQLQHIREPRPLPSYGMPTDEDEWDMNSSGLGDSLAVDCR